MLEAHPGMKIGELISIEEAQRLLELTDRQMRRRLENGYMQRVRLPNKSYMLLRSSFEDYRRRPIEPDERPGVIFAKPAWDSTLVELMQGDDLTDRPQVRTVLLSRFDSPERVELMRTLWNTEGDEWNTGERKSEEERLMLMLAGWTGGNEERMRVLFRQSKLWTRAHDGQIGSPRTPRIQVLVAGALADWQG